MRLAFCFLLGTEGFLPGGGLATNVIIRRVWKPSSWRVNHKSDVNPQQIHKKTGQAGAMPDALVLLRGLFHVTLLQALFFGKGIAVQNQTLLKQSLTEG